MDTQTTPSSATTIPRNLNTNAPRLKGPPLGLRIHPPAPSSSIVVATDDSVASSALSPTTSDSDSLPIPSLAPRKPTGKAASMRNVKRLSLVLPSAQSNASEASLAVPAPKEVNDGLLKPDFSLSKTRPRQASTVSLPAPSASACLFRKDEDGGDAPPYVDGPIEILPGVWLGSEDNARDWQGLVTRGIKSILNVAKEVNSPFDSLSANQTLRPFASTPNLKQKFKDQENTFYPAHAPSGRPAMHYLKLAWSHGQSDLVKEGFAAAMAFVDAALERRQGVLIHCQCGVSRSATLVIALVMRAASVPSPSVPAEVLALKNGGMHGAYDFVKTKSKWVGPNMSLMYQLMDYERALKGTNGSSPGASSSINEEDEDEWRGRTGSGHVSPESDSDRESSAVMNEASALDKAMEDRIVARRRSNSSVGSSFVGAIGTGTTWKSRYQLHRRAGSVRSNLTTSSILTENLLDEDESSELSGMEDASDRSSVRTTSPDTDVTEDTASVLKVTKPDTRCSLPPIPATPKTATPDFSSAMKAVDRLTSTYNPPPSAPASKFSFGLPRRFKRRPPPLGLGLSPVPSSPITSSIASPHESRPPMLSHMSAPTHITAHEKPKKHIYDRLKRAPTSMPAPAPSAPTPTLFVFPPSPTTSAQTPSAVTVFTTTPPSASSPSLQTPRVSTFKSHGRSKSFISLRTPSTPSVASSRVDAYGWFGKLASSRT